MCGITGFVNFKENIKENIGTLKAMTDTLIHRGPNAEGTYISNNIMFGHRRLIVVDPEGGKQPMKKVVNGKEYVLVYNGELYNTEDLRKELINDGYIFEGYSDTEVLLTSYIRWGLDCIKKFNGIFAFAIYDENEKRVVLARDVMGVKPLFYTMKNGTFIFGSEIKALFKHPYVEPVVDKDGLTELFALGPAVIPGTTVYKNIEEVKPAQYIIVNEDGIKKDIYWELKAEEFNENEEEAVEHVRSLLIDAIDRQLVGDVPLCTFLSGGLDSSAISAIAAKEYKKRNKTLTTYSIDYEDNEKYFKSSLFQPTSDQHFAEIMAEYIGSDHRTVVLNHRDLVNALDDAVFGRDLPGMADVDSSLYLFCKEVKKDFVIALSGECADELFGGYPWFTNEEMINSNTFPWSRFIGERKAILSPDLKNLKIEEVAQTAYNDTLKEVPHLSGESKLEHRMRELFYLNLRWFMVNLLNRKDRMSMANSLEVRVPFADYRLVEYAFNIPSNIKLLEGREKGLLRKSLEGILPESIIYRKKSPYPKTHNPIYTEMVCNKMTKILNDKSSPILDIIDKTKVKEIVDTQGSSYKTPWYGQLMTGPQMIAYLIQVNNWLKSYNVKLM
ncbi:asparagine synthase (glutamine-hydrolyzing) [Clostridium tertium]|jgi:asparagine synthase (glutamine-hydrolysing)|uniref:asparagine synthase (glutamine-hydrolyzing) n=1 Tax=Clostridium TaxID=1485 RepID=UPI000287CAFA|nr:MULTISPECIES: asparagine synthase (glutamine-hydrolyzing) [Clostridium]MDU8966569.1 asparagine synthase (glutamine-hydrolyzing) [Clostridium sp.]EEH98921.2 asparagine synthase (glutamine-hydrolyzing) [Clostridium sp. 7_2_43FAA]MDB1956406.1 asparagine synthase (glutamine-hydrolyzing) [Clostridium tertium]MDB1957731.1 asparagine synthase (glutamine-hydrolyzing) [Clostridium tertium]MDB1961526.1 asparagine synthase (glutamine-hydrolyzing) [Clostridium tertium]